MGIKIRPIDLTIISGTSVTITIPPQFLKNGKFFDLEFCLSEPDRVAFRDLIEGIEVVTIQNGVSGVSYVLENSTGNTFYSDRLHIGFCYRLKWGNNGPSIQTGQESGIAHFINLNTPCCARPYDPANNTIPPAGDVTA